MLHIDPSVIATDFADGEKERCERRLAKFMRSAWHLLEPTHPYRHGWHIDCMADHLTAVTHGHIKNLLMCVPPGCCKSYTVSVFWFCWEWIHDPTLRWITASYDDKLATRDSLRCRKLLSSKWYQDKWGDRFTFYNDQNQKTHFENNLGGYRFATSVGGHGTGEHPDRIVCLPFDAEITTASGVLPIGEIVDNKLSVPIRSFNHETGAYEWDEIEEWESSAGRPMTRITFADGNCLELTDDHPVFVIGKGYIEASQVVGGDRTIIDDQMQVQTMRQGALAQAESSTSVLQHEMSRAISKDNACGGVRSVREESVPVQRSLETGETGSVLLASVSRSVYTREEPSLVAWDSEKALSKLPKDVCSREASRNYGGGMQSTLFVEMVQGSPAKTGQESESQVREVQKSDAVASKMCQDNPLLLSRLRERSAFVANGWGWQSALYPRSGKRTLRLGVHRDPQTYSTARRLCVRALSSDSEKVRETTRRSSHRFQQAEQLDGQSDFALSCLSRHEQLWKEPTTQIGESVVAHVEKSIRIPSRVFNIRVKRNHNYFANGVLVHNCDDPISAKKARSKAVRDNCLLWWNETIATRGISRKVAKVVIMQRLHTNDLAGWLMENEPDDWEVIILPMRYEPGRMRTTMLGWYDLREGGYKPSLLYPKLFPEPEVQKLERKLGEYATAGQLAQRPMPEGGGIIKTADIVTVSEVQGKRIATARAWDLASTRKRGDETAGAKLSLSTDGFTYVEHVNSGNWSLVERDNEIDKTAKADTRAVLIGIPKDPASGGLTQAMYYVKKLRNYRVKVMPTDTSKEARLDPFATAVGLGLVRFVEGPWMKKTTDQLTTFPNGEHDDICDSIGDAYSILIESQEAKIKHEWFNNWFMRASSVWTVADGIERQLSPLESMRTVITLIPNSLDRMPLTSYNRYSSLVVWSRDQTHAKTLVRFCWFGLADHNELLDGLSSAINGYGAKSLVVSAGEVGLGFVETLRNKHRDVDIHLVDRVKCSEEYLKFAEQVSCGEILIPIDEEATYLEFTQNVCGWGGNDDEFNGYVGSGIIAERFITNELGSWGGFVPQGKVRIAGDMKPNSYKEFGEFFFG